jgi:hypothetical protein
MIPQWILLQLLIIYLNRSAFITSYCCHLLENKKTKQIVVCLCKSNKQSKSSPVATIFISEEVRNKGIRGWKTGKESLTSSTEELCARCRGAGWRQRSRACPVQGRRRGRQGGGRGAVLLSCAGEAGGVLVGVGFRVETGLTRLKKARWAVSKTEYTYGYSYRHV